MPTEEMTTAGRVRDIVENSPVKCLRCAELRVKYSDAIRSTASAEAMFKTTFAEYEKDFIKDEGRKQVVRIWQNRIAIRARIEVATARRLMSHTLTCITTVREVSQND